MLCTVKGFGSNICHLCSVCSHPKIWLAGISVVSNKKSIWVAFRVPTFLVTLIITQLLPTVACPSHILFIQSSVTDSDITTTICVYFCNLVDISLGKQIIVKAHNKAMRINNKGVSKYSNNWRAHGKWLQFFCNQIMKCLFTGIQWLSEASNHRATIGSFQQSKCSCNLLPIYANYIMCYIPKDLFYFLVCYCWEARWEIHKLCRLPKELHRYIEWTVQWLGFFETVEWNCRY